MCGFSIILILKGFHDVLRSNSLCILLNKNLNFNEDKMKSKMENPTYSFRENKLVLQFIKESQIKRKTVKS